MIHPRELLTDTALYGATEVVNRSLPFLLLPVFTAYLTPADFGVSAMVATMVVFLAPVFSLGLGAGTAPCYFAHSELVGRRATINTALIMVLASGASLVCLTILLADWISLASFGRSDYRRFAVIGAATTTFSMLTVPLRQYFQFERRARLYVVLSTVSAVISVLLSVAMIVVLRRGVWGFVVATMLGQAATLALFAVAYGPAFRPVFDPAIARRLLRVGLPLVPAFAALFVLQHASKFFIQWMRGLEQVGIFSIGFNVGLVLSVIVTGFQSAWVPFFMSYADRAEDARATIGRVTTYFVYAVGGASLVIWALARPLMMVLTTSQYQPAWRVVGLSATAQFLNGLFIVLLPGMYYANEVQFVGVIQSTAALCGLILNWILVRQFGFLGAAVAIVLSYLLLDLLTYAWNRRRGYLRVRYDARRLATFGAFYVCFTAGLSIDYSLSLGFAVLMGGAAIILLGAFLFLQLTRSERTAAIGVLDRFSARPSADASRVAATPLSKDLS